MITTETISSGKATTSPPVLFKSILFATDFSEVATKALTYAAGIARTHCAKLRIVHVLPAEAPPQIPMEPLPASLDRGYVEAEANMQALGTGKFLLGLPHEDIVERGPIQEVIADLIRRNNIHLLVLGTHGRGGLNKFLLGSVAEELFRTATSPVLTVGAKVPQPPETGNRRRDVRPEIFLCSECIDTARRSGNVVKLTGQSMKRSYCATCSILNEERIPA